MGKEKYQKQIEELFKKSPVVSFSSIERIIKNKKNITQYSKQLVRNLLLNGKIKSLAKGYYSTHDEPSLNVFCFSPSYLGLQDSLSTHNLWEQETVPIIITQKRVRSGLRKTKLGNILIRRIDKKYIFGVEYKKIGEFYLPYSDIEKTFIDFVYFNQKMDKNVVDNIKKIIDKKKLSLYLEKYPNKFREKVKRMLV
jgi:predicted transcriptional regulator of viral defense system